MVVECVVVLLFGATVVLFLAAVVVANVVVTLGTLVVLCRTVDDDDDDNDDDDVDDDDDGDDGEYTLDVIDVEFVKWVAGSVALDVDASRWVDTIDVVEMSGDAIDELWLNAVYSGDSITNSPCRSNANAVRLVWFETL